MEKIINYLEETIDFNDDEQHGKEINAAPYVPPPQDQAPAKRQASQQDNINTMSCRRGNSDQEQEENDHNKCENCCRWINTNDQERYAIQNKFNQTSYYYTHPPTYIHLFDFCY